MSFVPIIRFSKIDSKIPANKNLPSTMGREGVPVVPPRLPPKRPLYAGLSILDIRYSNTECRVSTTLITQGLRPKLLTFNLQRVNSGGSRGNFNWVRTSATFSGASHISGGFCQPTFLCHSLLFLIAVIICENNVLSRLTQIMP